MGEIAACDRKKTKKKEITITETRKSN